MNNIDKIKGLMESLTNEFENLQTMLVTMGSESERLKEKDIELSTKELFLSTKESKLLLQTKVNGENKKEINSLREQLEAKQLKLQQEWDKMLFEKEAWTKVKESMVKEKLRLKNLSKELETVKKELETVKKDLFDKTTVMSKKEESTQTMIQMLTAKEKVLNESQRKVDQYLGSI